MMILSTKIIFTAIFFNTTIKFVVSELKRDKKLRNFFKINDDVPNALPHDTQIFTEIMETIQKRHPIRKRDTIIF
jgi:hypothetical protein